MLMPDRPPIVLLADEQQRIQANNPDCRTLAQYDEYMFTEIRGIPSEEWSATAFLANRCAEDEPSVTSLLEGLAEGKDRPVHWADMGSGHGVAMRCVSSRIDMDPKPLMTGVDARNLSLGQVGEQVIRFTEGHYPRFAESEHEPEFVQADVHVVELDKPVDLITAVEVVQYLDDPLRAITNWYNQLADGGIMSVVAGHSWGRRILDATPTEDRMGHRPIIGDFIDVLKQAGVQFGFGDRDSDQFGWKPERTRTLAIEKKPDTKLIMNTRLASPYTHALYEPPLTRREPVLVV